VGGGAGGGGGATRSPDRCAAVTLGLREDEECAVVPAGLDVTESTRSGPD